MQFTNHQVKENAELIFNDLRNEYYLSTLVEGALFICKSSDLKCILFVGLGRYIRAIRKSKKESVNE